MRGTAYAMHRPRVTVCHEENPPEPAHIFTREFSHRSQPERHQIPAVWPGVLHAICNNYLMDKELQIYPLPPYWWKGGLAGRFFVAWDWYYGTRVFPLRAARQ
jgi:hypothetical protein